MHLYLSRAIAPIDIEDMKTGMAWPEIKGMVKMSYMKVVNTKGPPVPGGDGKCSNESIYMSTCSFQALDIDCCTFWNMQLVEVNIVMNVGHCLGDLSKVPLE